MADHGIQTLAKDLGQAGTLQWIFQAGIVGRARLVAR